MNNLYKVLTEWIIYNVIIPLLLPPFTLLLYSKLLGHITEKFNNFTGIFIELFNNGVYLFLGASLLISTLCNYRTAKDVFSPLVWAIIFILVLVTMFLFLSATNIIVGVRSLPENLSTNITVLVASVIVSMYINYKALKVQLKFKII